MSGTAMSGPSGSDGSQKWAALDSQNERLVDPAHPLLLQLKRADADEDRQLPAAS